MDILIIGAGPAGCTASLFLSKMGIRHTVVEAAEFPRDKICGDGLDLKVIRVLRHLDPEITLDGEHFMPVHGTRFILKNGKTVDFQAAKSDQPLFHTAKRLHFDHFLFQKLDHRTADIHTNTLVENIMRDGDGWIVQASCSGRTVEFRPRLILAADGDHSVMLRYLGERKIDRRHYAATLRQYWKGVAGVPESPNLLEIYFPKGLPMSYFYIFPLPNGEANVGYGMTSEVLAKSGLKLRQVFENMLKNDPVLSDRFASATPLETPKGWGLPLASLRRKNFGDGYLLLGDAASLICPTSGEGIGTGMMSGFIAAQFAAHALQNRRFDAEQFKNYDREVYRRLNSEIRLYNSMIRLSPRVYDTVLNFLAPNPLFKMYFSKSVPGWLRTAYETPIKVDV
ncbi:MAG: geranylgeranyl reductase family protein [Saprospiraceae bacterium]|nr:geranylgeranyl reductase family protein [Saprospiraceae bacterium]